MLGLATARAHIGGTNALRPQHLDATIIPPPDFGDLPLSQYLSPELILPILGSRGCYWGKCEFCHHGMVYGAYSAAGIVKLQNDISHLSGVYGAKAFSFNDEAIPPKLFRAIGATFLPASETGFVFTGLLKFERFFTSDDWRRARAVGFRSLYIGLESASERVLALIQKHTPFSEILRCLTRMTTKSP